MSDPKPGMWERGCQQSSNIEHGHFINTDWYHYKVSAYHTTELNLTIRYATIQQHNIKMEDRHALSEPRLQSSTDKDCLVWLVDIYRNGVVSPIDTIEISGITLPPRKKKGKVVWRLPSDQSRLVSYYACFVLFCFVLFCFVLFCFVLFYMLLCFNMCYFVLYVCLLYSTV